MSFLTLVKAFGQNFAVTIKRHTDEVPVDEIFLVYLLNDIAYSYIFNNGRNK